MLRGIRLCFLTAECKDGRYIQMCARQDHHFRNWMAALGFPQLMEEERFSRAPMGFTREEDVDELEAIVRFLRVGTEVVDARAAEIRAELDG